MLTVKINNIPRWISEIHLKQFFANCGKILQANIAMDPATLRPLGYGFLTLENEDAVNKALALDGARLDGAVIEVVMNVEQEEEEVSLI